jgi:hypothetical protein
MNTYRRILVAILAVALLMGATCHKAGSTLTPAQQTTVNLWAAVNTISSANRAIAQTVVTLNAQKQLSDDLTRAILAYSKEATAVERGAVVVLDSAKTPQEKVAAVFDLLRTLNLPPSIQQFLNSSPTGQAVAALVNSIVSIQQAIGRTLATPPALVSVTKGAV